MTDLSSCSTTLPGTEGTYSPQSGKGTFTGAPIYGNISPADHIRMYWNFFFGGRDRTPAATLPWQKVQAADLVSPGPDRLHAIWLGHSSLLIRIDGRTLLTDPLFERRVSPVGPTMFRPQLPLDVEDLPPLDTVLISHDHYDHLNKYSVQRLAGRTDRFIVPLGVGDRLRRWGIDGGKIVELGWWQEYRDGNLLLAATPAHHFSGRGLFDRNSTLWASWVILGDRHRVFFSGDSGYFDGFRQIGKKYGPFDVTFIECGAYNETWPGVHLFPEQTARAHLDLRGAVLQPIHWATFNLAMHPWYEPAERLAAAAESAGIRLSTPIVGQPVDYRDIAATAWWRTAMATKEEMP